MSSQLLQSELLNLIQESKRKNADLRNAAEESLNDLKALPSTSEAQISADLVRKPRFVNPFILACHSRHAKLAGIGVVCLQRLVASKSLPSERLKDVLGGLKEITTLSKCSCPRSMSLRLTFKRPGYSTQNLANSTIVAAALF
ncbi:Putative Endosomal peripheral membrane protein [Aspergillus calidoustus]|uniref:Putative Endosomal peripheral membrane protein n=1 Tax=Aspergillus calidoustus TaxID=454130 RepID=A0A0U5GJY2_ASPCI|nr:Putative Endosomal peripheral membrane protein [Aspergillus calidoustus]